MLKRPAGPASIPRLGRADLRARMGDRLGPVGGAADTGEFQSGGVTGAQHLVLVHGLIGSVPWNPAALMALNLSATEAPSMPTVPYMMPFFRASARGSAAMAVEGPRQGSGPPRSTGERNHAIHGRKCIKPACTSRDRQRHDAEIHVPGQRGVGRQLLLRVERLLPR